MAAEVAETPAAVEDDPWAEPEPEKVVEEPVDTIEITYIDPKSAELCRRDVFCDPEDWKDKYISRLLVSADLVNSLSEAQGTWHGRFDDIHKRLQNSRLAYFHELTSIRHFVQKLREHIDRMDEPQSPKSPKSDGQPVSPKEKTPASPKERAPKDGEPPQQFEVCPVHFFLPDIYLDSWTIERRDKAIEVFSEELRNEIKRINERIELLGGGTWRQLVAYFLRTGHSPVNIAESLMKVVTDAEERRGIENTITGGIRNDYDALDEYMKLLQVEAADMSKRWLHVSNQENKQDALLEQLRKRLKELIDKLNEPDPEEPPEDPAEAAAALARLFDELEEKLKDLDEEIANLKAELEDLLANPPDDEETKKLEKEAKAAERRLRMIQLRIERTNAKTAETNDRVTALEEKMARERDTMAGLQEKLARLPPPTDEALAFKRMQREFKNLKQQEVDIQKAMIKPANRIRAMRAQMRILYKNLGWDWDLSDSEDEDGEEKPYWKRRQIAVDGFLPFDPRHFVYGEKNYKQTRYAKRCDYHNTNKESTLISQMTARREHWSDRSIGGDEAERTEEAGPVMFGSPAKDPVDQAISNARELLSVRSRGSLRGPTRAQRLQEERWNAHLLQLQHLRESFEVQVRQCVECFVDLLPPDGVVGDLRFKLQDMVQQLGDLPSDPAAWADSGLDLQIEQTCLALQSTIEEVITYGDTVHPICAAMIHSVEFSELRARLAQVMHTEREIRENLKASRQFRDTKQYRAPKAASADASVMSARGVAGESGELKSTELSSPSSSPRLKTAPPLGAGAGARASPGSPESAAATSSPRLDSNTPPLMNAGFGGSLSVESRNLPASPQIAGPLKLPPRLLASAESLLGSRSKQRQRRRGGRQVDFGFRPDGSGEESLENWSLFKVSKGANADRTTGTGFGLSAGTTFLSEKLKRTDSKVRHHRGPVECDFHEYMAQSHGRSADVSWMSASISASTPSLGSNVSERRGDEKKKRCPSLPQLIKAKDAGTSGKASSGQQASAPGFTNKDHLQAWSRGTKRIDEYTRMFPKTQLRS